AISDDRIPIPVRLFLILRQDLERKSLGMPVRRAAVQTKARNAHHGKFHGEYIALLPAWIIAGRLMNRNDPAVRKRSRIKTRRILRVFIEPQTNRILCFQIGIPPQPDPIARNFVASGPKFDRKETSSRVRRDAVEQPEKTFLPPNRVFRFPIAFHRDLASGARTLPQPEAPIPIDFQRSPRAEHVL